MWLIWVSACIAFLLPFSLGVIFIKIQVEEPRFVLALFLSSIFLWLFHKFATFHEKALLGKEETNLVLDGEFYLKVNIKELTEAHKRLASEPFIKQRFRFNYEDLSLSGIEDELRKYQRAYLGRLYAYCKIPCLPFACLWALFCVAEICNYIRTTFF